MSNIELVNCDCMDYMRGLPDNAFDLAIVDPPYGMGINSSGRLGHYGGKGKTWDSSAPDFAYFAELRRITNHQIVWGGNYFPMPPTRCFLIWDKQQPEGVSFASCEFAWTSFDASAKTYYQRPQNADQIRIHPSQKPVSLYEWLLANYAKPGQRILDTHGGSMSIAIACHNLGFDLTLCELDSDYYKAGVERFERHKAQGLLFTPEKYQDAYDQTTLLDKLEAK